MGCLDGMNGQMPYDGKDISLKPIHQSFRVPWRLANRPPGPPLAGHVLKAVLSLALGCLSFFLRCFGFRLAFGHRIDAGRSNFFATK
jgi:hypothetical protein